MDWFRSPSRGTKPNIIRVQDLVDDTLYSGSPRTSTTTGDHDGRPWLFFPTLNRNFGTNTKNSRRDRRGGFSSCDPGWPPEQQDSFDWRGKSTNPDKVHFFTRLVDEVPGFAARHGVRRVAPPKASAAAADNSSSAASSESESDRTTGRTSHWSSSTTLPSTQTFFASPHFNDICDACPVQSILPATPSKPSRQAFEIFRAEDFDEDAYEADLDKIIALHDRDVEDEIDTFVAIVTSPDGLAFDKSPAHEASRSRHGDNGKSAHGSPVLASREPIWNGTVLDRGATLCENLGMGEFDWKQVGRKVCHEELRSTSS